MNAENVMENCTEKNTSWILKEIPSKMGFKFSNMIYNGKTGRNYSKEEIIYLNISKQYAEEKAKDLTLIMTI